MQKHKPNKHIDITAGRQKMTIKQTEAQFQKQKQNTQNKNKHTNK